MNVEIKTETAQLLFWEHIIGIFVAVCAIMRLFCLSKIHLATGFNIENTNKSEQVAKVC
jgi:hypothetical protein